MRCAKFQDMSTTRALISVEEYLTTVYESDCDYVDGEVLERNMGESDHSWLQGALIIFLGSRRAEWNITVMPEMRVQVAKNRFRVPDICVVLGGRPRERILTTPPFLCIEILSSEDRWTRVEERINDFLAMGVAYVWVIDPATRQTYVATAAEGLRESKDGILRTADPSFEVSIPELYS